MTARQKAFIEEYKKDKNQTQAAIRAGYSKKTAAQKGSYLRNHDHEVSKAIDAWEEEMHQKNTAQAAEIEEFLTSVLRGEIQEQIPLLAGNGFQELTGNIPMIKDRMKAAELLGKRYGLFTEKVEVDTDTGVIVLAEVEDIGT